MADSLGLVVIDVQREYFTDGRPLAVERGDAVLGRVTDLLDAARRTETPVVHVQHVSADPDDDTFAAGSEYTQIVDEIEVQAGEPVVTKSNPGAFHDTPLDRHLRKRGIETIAVAGLLSFLCVDTTAREADARGYRPLYVRDATSAVDLADVSAAEIDRVVEAVQSALFSDVVTAADVVERMEGTV